MAGAATDLLQEVGLPGSATTLTANYTIGDTSITVGSTSLMPSATGFTFAIDRAEIVTVGGQSVEQRIAGTYCEFVGVVSGANTIASVTKTFGTDQNYTSGSLTRVYIPVSSTRENRLVEWGLVSHNQNGTLKNNAVTTVSMQDSSVTTDKLSAAAVTPAKWVNSYKFGANRSTTQSLGASSATTVIFNTEEYDSNSNYDVATGLYTAPAAGFYHFSAGIGINPSASSTRYIGLTKNGTEIKRGNRLDSSSLSNHVISVNVQLAQNDTVGIIAFSTIATSLEAQASSNWFCGNVVSLT